jgi:hypothetical protein
MAIYDAAEITVTIAGVTLSDFATDDRTTVYASDPFSVARRSEVANAGTLPEVFAAGAEGQRRDKTELHALLLVLCESYREMGKAYAWSRSLCLERSDPATARAFERSSLTSLVIADYVESLAALVLCQDYEEEAQKLYQSFVNSDADDHECAKLLAKAEEAEARLHLEDFRMASYLTVTGAGVSEYNLIEVRRLPEDKRRALAYIVSHEYPGPELRSGPCGCDPDKAVQCFAPDHSSIRCGTCRSAWSTCDHKDGPVQRSWNFNMRAMVGLETSLEKPGAYTETARERARKLIENQSDIPIPPKAGKAGGLSAFVTSGVEMPTKVPKSEVNLDAYLEAGWVDEAWVAEEKAKRLLGACEAISPHGHRCEVPGGSDHAGVHWAKTPESERSRSVHDSVSWTGTWGVGGAAR